MLAMPMRAIVVVATIAVAITGCTVAQPSPPGAPTPAETAAAAAKVEPAASIVIGSESVSITDGEANAEEFNYFTTGVGPIVARLTELLGEQPERTEHTTQGFTHSVSYRWGGLTVRKHFDFDLGFPSLNEWSVTATTAEESGVAIVTRDGIAVGSRVPDAEAASFRQYADYTQPGSPQALLLDYEVWRSAMGRFATSVLVSPQESEVIERIEAPLSNPAGTADYADVLAGKTTEN